MSFLSPQRRRQTTISLLTRNISDNNKVLKNERFLFTWVIKGKLCKLFYVSINQIEPARVFFLPGSFKEIIRRRHHASVLKRTPPLLFCLGEKTEYAQNMSMVVKPRWLKKWAWSNTERHQKLCMVKIWAWLKKPSMVKNRAWLKNRAWSKTEHGWKNRAWLKKPSMVEKLSMVKKWAWLLNCT